MPKEFISITKEFKQVIFVAIHLYTCNYSALLYKSDNPGLKGAGLMKYGSIICKDCTFYLGMDRFLLERAIVCLRGSQICTHRHTGGKPLWELWGKNNFFTIFVIHPYSVLHFLLLS
jgi:hypothetical protein